MCLVETTYLVEKGRVPATALERLSRAVQDLDNGFRVAPLDLAVAIRLREIPRDVVPDLPDRVIAATALAMGLTLVTCDNRIRSAGIPTLW